MENQHREQSGQQEPLVRVPSEVAAEAAGGAILFFGQQVQLTHPLGAGIAANLAAQVAR
ncbi:MAG TPA: hypothetical protein VLG47_06870 [Candidatus Saccharimonadales bacterium]|nr:hypothetical protein [Candidatus Saccharimonadales bacterium]